ncbi:hypothetical protein KUTeg_018850 [Tegillarca granosa]|uniref:G8 domain-containing protein n=1 Tax=Tegillarca granosa TaxID=220873 RepID=A0ABQ9EAS5_TEGGR|nr:hypothetical protein KUTeg_018850 [Tegillarca granosa]
MCFPGVNENVTITTSVLLDESPPELFSIIIEKSGRLVWSPNVDIHLRVHYILIRGRMDIGGESADCKYQANTSITLIGERGEYSIQDFDEKFIGVAPNGTLELHGQYKHPWTKLTSTLNKYSPENGMIFRHKDQDREVVKRWISGIQIHVFDRQTGSPINNGLFRLAWRRDTQFETIRDQMLTFLSGMYMSVYKSYAKGVVSDFIQNVLTEEYTIPQGTVVAMAAQKTIVKHDMSAIYDAIEEVVFGPSSTQSSLIRNLDTKGAWALITVRGHLF